MLMNDIDCCLMENISLEKNHTSKGYHILARIKRYV